MEVGRILFGYCLLAAALYFGVATIGGGGFFSVSACIMLAYFGGYILGHQAGHEEMDNERKASNSSID